MEIIKLNTKLDKFYKPWAKVQSFPLPDGTHFITKDLLTVDYLSGIESDVDPIKDSETKIFDMPAMGELCTEDVVYKFIDDEDESYVICRQTHNRTEHDPSTIPALFTFYRENSDDLEWMPNELVETGWKRVHDGTTYECIQGHMTQSDWTPPATLNVLWLVYVGTTTEAPATTTGAPATTTEQAATTTLAGVDEWAAGVSYTVGDLVTYDGITYSCRQSHTSQAHWTPPAVLALWLPQ